MPFGHRVPRLAYVTQDIYGGEVTQYAAQPEPEKRPWRKRKSLLDEAFQAELDKAKKLSAEQSRAEQSRATARVIHTSGLSPPAQNAVGQP